jgi:hypothetical protein
MERSKKANGMLKYRLYEEMFKIKVVELKRLYWTNTDQNN